MKDRFPRDFYSWVSARATAGNWTAIVFGNSVHFHQNGQILLYWFTFSLLVAVGGKVDLFFETYERENLNIWTDLTHLQSCFGPFTCWFAVWSHCCSYAASDIVTFPCLPAMFQFSLFLGNWNQNQSLKGTRRNIYSGCTSSKYVQPKSE